MRPFFLGWKPKWLLDEKYLKNDRTAAAYFYQAGDTPVGAGSTLRNPALAEVLRQIASQGSNALMAGPVAQAHGMPLWLGGADPRREGLVMGD